MSCRRYRRSRSLPSTAYVTLDSKYKNVIWYANTVAISHFAASCINEESAQELMNLGTKVQEIGKADLEEAIARAKI